MKQVFCCPSMSSMAFSAISLRLASRAVSPFNSSILRFTWICSSSPLWVISELKDCSFSLRAASVVFLSPDFCRRSSFLALKSAYLFFQAGELQRCFFKSCQKQKSFLHLQLLAVRLVRMGLISLLFQPGELCGHFL